MGSLISFVQTGSLISLVSDNHVDNYLKEIWVYIHLGSVVNNWAKNIMWILPLIWNYGSYDVPVNISDADVEKNNVQYDRQR